jgi:2-keto-4-pentenoate hydratase
MQAWDDPRIAGGMTTQLARRRARVAAGERPIGWKLGLGAPAMLEKFTLKAPLVGHLFQGSVLASGATASLKGYGKPIAEPEIAVIMGADLAPGADAATALAAIRSLTPAIEIADMTPPPADVTAILADNIFHRHVVFGNASRPGGDTAGLTARVIRRGAEAAHSDTPEALTGKIVDLVRHVAGTLAAHGEKLAAGDIIICGSITPPIAIEPDETELTYWLDPVGPVSVKLSRI